jgi:hypothetical protein
MSKTGRFDSFNQALEAIQRRQAPDLDELPEEDRQALRTAQRLSGFARSGQSQARSKLRKRLLEQALRQEGARRGGWLPAMQRLFQSASSMALVAALALLAGSFVMSLGGGSPSIGASAPAYATAHVFQGESTPTVLVSYDQVQPLLLEPIPTPMIPHAALTPPSTPPLGPQTYSPTLAPIVTP